MNNNPETIGRVDFLQPGLADNFQCFCQFLDVRIASSALPVRTTGEFDSETSTVMHDLGELTAAVVAEIKRIGKTVSAQQPELSNATLHEFQFLLAAWADESLIKIGQSRLPVEQRGNVERSMFGTVHAGDEFFHAVERMLSRRNADDICIAGAYWLALMLGFEGRYIGGSGAKELRRYADSLRSIALRISVPPENSAPRPNESFASTNVGLRAKSHWSTKSRTYLLVTFAFLAIAVFSLEVQWDKNTEKLAQILKAMSDLHQSDAGYRELK